MWNSHRLSRVVLTRALASRPVAGSFLASPRPALLLGLQARSSFSSESEEERIRRAREEWQQKQEAWRNTLATSRQEWHGSSSGGSPSSFGSPSHPRSSSSSSPVTPLSDLAGSVPPLVGGVPHNASSGSAYGPPPFSTPPQPPISSSSSDPLHLLKQTMSPNESSTPDFKDDSEKREYYKKERKRLTEEKKQRRDQDARHPMSGALRKVVFATLTFGFSLYFLGEYVDAKVGELNVLVSFLILSSCLCGFF